MSESELTLYQYWRSSCSWRLRWALALKDLPYEIVSVNLLKGEQRLPAFRVKNPSAFVPCLEIDGEVHCESLALLEWLDEAYPIPSLCPGNPRERLWIRQLACTIGVGVQPLQNPIALSKHTAGSNLSREDLARFWIARGLLAYESLLQRHQPGRFSCGPMITLADLCLIPQVYNAKRFDVNTLEYPMIDQLYKNCMETEACQVSSPERQPDAIPPEH